MAERMVKCVKLNRELPGLPFRPFRDELGQQLYDHVSFEGWRMWLEHSKMIVNEYRLDLNTPKAHELLKQQCRAFFFDEGGEAAPPPDYVPPSDERP